MIIMPSGKTHVLTGVCTAAIAARVDPVLISPEGVWCATGLLTGVILPDIDKRNTTASDSSLTARGITAVAGRFIQHRGFTHSILAAVGIGVLTTFAVLPLSQIAGIWLNAELLRIAAPVPQLVEIIRYLGDGIVFGLLAALFTSLTLAALREAGVWFSFAIRLVLPILALIAGNRLMQEITSPEMVLLGIGLAAGMLLHSWGGDMWTRDGVEALWPIRRKIHLARIFKLKKIREGWIAGAWIGLTTAVWLLPMALNYFHME